MQRRAREAMQRNAMNLQKKRWQENRSWMAHLASSHWTGWLWYADFWNIQMFRGGFGGPRIPPPPNYVLGLGLGLVSLLGHLGRRKFFGPLFGLLFCVAHHTCPLPPGYIWYIWPLGGLRNRRWGHRKGGCQAPQEKNTPTGKARTPFIIQWWEPHKPGNNPEFPCSQRHWFLSWKTQPPAPAWEKKFPARFRTGWGGCQAGKNPRKKTSISKKKGVNLVQTSLY